MKYITMASLFVLSEVQKIAATPISISNSSSYSQTNSQSESHHTVDKSVSSSAGMLIFLSPVFALLIAGAYGLTVKSKESATTNGVNTQYTAINVDHPQQQGNKPFGNCCK